MNIVLGHEGIQALRNQLQAISDNLDNTVKKAEKALAEEGFQLLKTNAPTNDIDGNRTGAVLMEQSSDGYRISYQGTDVAYIEFGTGYKGASRPYPKNTVGWQYDVNGHGASGWFYYSKTDGSLQYSKGGMYPEMPVYKSYTELQNRAKEIIKGVLDDIY